MSLFEGSFDHVWNFALQTLEFKMEILECFVITQVRVSSQTDDRILVINPSIQMCKKPNL